MRTFHTGGVAGGDITQGLPRVEELFEARRPKGMCIISEIDGVVEIRQNKKKEEIVVVDPETGNSKAYLHTYGTELKKLSDGTHLGDGTVVKAGDQLTAGSIHPHDLPQQSRYMREMLWFQHGNRRAGTGRRTGRHHRCTVHR